MDRSEEEAAARIQAVQRGRLARFSVDRRRRSLVRQDATARWDREHAAIKIQAACRGTRGRAEGTHYQEQQAAASKIQAKIRAGKARKDANRAARGSLPLDRADVKKGLHTLGRNPHDMRQCYVGLMAPNAGVSDINAIVGFPLLQTVDLSGNCISSVKPLSRLPFLHEIDVSHNCLTSVLDYELFEGEDFSWRASQEWLHDWRSNVVRSVSMLHRANLSYNSITGMQDLTHHRNLQELDLSHNKVEEMQGLSSLKCLRILKLSHNKIRRIGGLDDLPLVELHLDHNYIGKIEHVGSEKLTNLRVLRLGYNAIENLSNLRSCLSLAVLDVAFNKISAVRQVEYLQDCPLLHTLVLEGNPVDRLEAYRARVIFRLHGLMLLDRNEISPQEKVKAVNLMGDDDSEVPHRRKVFRQHLPDQDFTNTLPPFCEPEGAPVPESCTEGEGAPESPLREESAVAMPEAVFLEAAIDRGREEVVTSAFSPCAALSRELEQ